MPVTSARKASILIGAFFTLSGCVHFGIRGGANGATVLPRSASYVTSENALLVAETGSRDSVIFRKYGDLYDGDVLADIRISRGKPFQTNRTIGDGEKINQHDPARQFLVRMPSSSLQGGPVIDIAAIGGLTSDIFYRACIRGSEVCLETTKDPCGSNGATWVHGVELSKVKDERLAIIIHCTQTPMGPNAWSSVKGYRNASLGWQTLVYWNGTKADYKNVARNTFLGPSTNIDGVFSVVHPTQAGFQVDNFDSQLAVSRRLDLAPVARNNLPVVMNSVQGISDLALWLDRGASLLPDNSRALAVTTIAGERAVFYSRRDKVGQELVCHQQQFAAEKCFATPLSDTKRAWEIRSFPQEDPEKVPLMYVWVPSSGKGEKWAVSIMGGPFYSSFELQLGQAQTLARLGYDVAVPLPTNGVKSSLSEMPALDAEGFQVGAVASQIDDLIVKLTLFRGGEKPLVASSSAGASFASALSAPITGHLMDSPSCFPLETLAEGFSFLLPGVSRAEIMDDGGTARLLAGASGNSCEGLRNQAVPIYGVAFKSDPNVGSKVISHTAEFFKTLPISKFVVLEGTQHGISDDDPQVAKIEQGVHFVERRSR